MDQTWKRILYSQSSSSQLNILSYGDNNNDYHFGIPRSIDVNEWGEIYIADSEKGIVNKLYYSSITNTITATSSVNFLQGLVKPVDADYYQGSTLWNRNDDLIAVSDEGDNSIVIYNSNGQFQCKLTGYYENGIKQIKSPKRVALFGYEFPYRLAFIDGGTNRLIVVRLPINFTNWTGWLHTISPPISFDLPSYLTDIGIDGCYNIIVPDRSKNMMHKFNKNGQYSCSFQGASNFSIPYFITNVPDNCPNPEMVWIDIALSSIWDINSGIRRYLPGADLKEISNAVFSNYYRLRFNPTDDIDYIAEIIRVQDNVVIKSFTGNAFNSIQKDLILNYNELPTNNTNYKWKFKYQPLYNSQYGNYSVSWQTLEFPFYHSIVRPTISSFTQSPNPLYKGSNGSVTCNLSQGNGGLNFNWSIVSGNIGFSISNTNSQTVSIHYSNTDAIAKTNSKNISSPKETPIEGPAGAVLKCIVWNSAGNDSLNAFINLSTTSHGCPFVYSWNGEIWVEDNNILPQSQDSTILGQDVTDFYQLYTKPILDEEKYYLAISEFEDEISYLDQLKLLVVDHPQETFITVDDNGEIIQFAKPAYFANAQLDSIDVYKKLIGLDSIKAEVSRDDTLKLLFEDVSVGTEKWLLLIGQQEPIYKDKIAVSVFRRNDFDKGRGKENTAEFSSFRLRKNPTYQWILVPDGNSSSLQVDIVFQSEAEIDYTELSHKLELPFTVYTPTLLYAEHSAFGDVTSLLNQIDEQYSVLNTDEMITLEYSAPPIDEGMERTFIFVSRGKYERLENKMLTKGNSHIENKNQNLSSTENTNIVYEYGLSQNYPNPFNPVTNIVYQLPKSGLVQLKVYNLLGQEIVTLLNEIQSSGIYEALFDASNLPSGVYIYSLRVNDFVQNNKMTLLK